MEPGQVFEVQCAGRGHLVLRRAQKRAPVSVAAPLLNIDPFPAGTLAAIYHETDPEWEAVAKAAALAQPKPLFEE